MAEPLVTHVSDTARWIASHRAQESARPDRLFSDPWAERLAGEQGHAIARQAPFSSGWPMIVRTRVLDDFVASSIAEGCDRVLNLAAGLDTRPLRLPLPPELQWFEADLPGLLDYKEPLLGDATPVCRLTRERVDLADASARRAFLERATAGAERVLVLTEGLLLYLDEAVVREIAADLAAVGIRWWALDLTSPAILQLMMRSKFFEDAPMKFAPPDGVAFFEKLGWELTDLRSSFHEAVRLKRMPWWARPFAWLPAADPRNPGRQRWSAVVRFRRA